MERVTVCQVCGLRVAEFICAKCHAHVCGHCFDKQTGLCIRCKYGS